MLIPAQSREECPALSTLALEPFPTHLGCSELRSPRWRIGADLVQFHGVFDAPMATPTGSAPPISLLAPRGVRRGTPFGSPCTAAAAHLLQAPLEEALTGVPLCVRHLVAAAGAVMRRETLVRERQKSS